MVLTDDERTPDGIIVGIEGDWEERAGGELSKALKPFLSDKKKENTHALIVTFPSSGGRISWAPFWKDRPGELNVKES